MLYRHVVPFRFFAHNISAIISHQLAHFSTSSYLSPHQPKALFPCSSQIAPHKNVIPPVYKGDASYKGNAANVTALSVPKFENTHLFLRINDKTRDGSVKATPVSSRIASGRNSGLKKVACALNYLKLHPEFVVAPEFVREQILKPIAYAFEHFYLALAMYIRMHEQLLEAEIDFTSNKKPPEDPAKILNFVAATVERQIANLNIKTIFWNMFDAEGISNSQIKIYRSALTEAMQDLLLVHNIVVKHFLLKQELDAHVQVDCSLPQVNLPQEFKSAFFTFSSKSASKGDSFVPKPGANATPESGNGYYVKN